MGGVERRPPDVCVNGRQSLWVTVTTCPATTIVAVRSEPSFLSALKFTSPEPVPDVPRVIVIQLAVVDAVQAQVGELALTSTDADPPFDEKERDVGEIRNVQLGAGAAG